MGINQLIFEAGVIGAGGAGFPTHKKLSSNVDTLIVNAAECEPLLSSDQYIMREFPDEIILALIAIKKEFEIERVVIGTKKKYTEEIACLNKSVKKHEADIEIHLLESFYPADDEQIMIYEITGQTVPPGGIPIALSIAVINITTAFNIYNAIHQMPVSRRYVTVTGEVANPAVYDVPIGAPLAGLVQAAGPLTEKYTIILGGPMMGKIYTQEQLNEVFITKTDGGIIILPENSHIENFAAQRLEHIINQARSVCIQCSYCTDMCPRYLIGHKIRPHRIMRSIATGSDAKALTEALLCCECGLCELYACPMGLSPRKVNIHIKNQLRKDGVKPPEGIDIGQAEKRYGRAVSQTRLLHRLGLGKYPGKLEEIKTFEPTFTCIPLKQGIGKPAVPIVSKGDMVETSQKIAAVDFNDVGANLHTGIGGIVRTVNKSMIHIERQGGTW